MKDILSGIKTPEIIALTDYLAIYSKPDKLNFVVSHSEVQWQNINQNKDGSYTKGKINAYVKRLQSEFYFEDETYESKIAQLCRLLDEETQLKKQVKSDGEKRIVSLATFLADVTGRNECVPFIFDDPISSLDQEYEEHTIERLVELSKSRQVIVFVHRLSFLSILTDKADDSLASIYIGTKPWGQESLARFLFWKENKRSHKYSTQSTPPKN